MGDGRTDRDMARFTNIFTTIQIHLRSILVCNSYFSLLGVERMDTISLPVIIVGRNCFWRL